MGDRRYKSKLFNFIWLQSMQLKDLWQQKARQAKVSATWGLQVSMYPLYLLFQTTRLAGRTLRQADTQGQRWLRATLEPEQDSRLGAVDRPIQRLMEAIQLTVIPPDPTPPSTQLAVGVNPSPQLMVSVRQLAPQSPNLRVRAQRWALGWLQRAQSALPRPQRQHPAVGITLQGVACDLGHRHPLLIAVGNEALDVLTLDQQQQLQQLIVWEVAHYHRQRRLVQQLPALNPWSHHRLPVRPPRSQMSPPIKVFRKLMAWVQTGPVATTINLFQETHILPPSPRLPDTPWAPLPVELPADLGITLNQLSPKLTPDAMELMDRAIANFESSSWTAIGPTAIELSTWVEQRLQSASIEPPGNPSDSISTRPIQPTALIGNPDHSTLNPALNAMLAIPSTLRTALSTLLGSATGPLREQTVATSSPAVAASMAIPSTTVASPHAEDSTIAVPVPTATTSKPEPNHPARQCNSPLTALSVSPSIDPFSASIQVQERGSVPPASSRTTHDADPSSVKPPPKSQQNLNPVPRIFKGLRDAIVPLLKTVSLSAAPTVPISAPSPQPETAPAAKTNGSHPLTTVSPYPLTQQPQLPTTPVDRSQPQPHPEIIEVVANNSPTPRPDKIQTVNITLTSEQSQPIASHEPPPIAPEKPDEIDVNAVFVAYEQHPLEQLLHWLDQATSWLETRLIHIVQTWWPRIKSVIHQLVSR